jgi:hypothetical protein
LRKGGSVSGRGNSSVSWKKDLGNRIGRPANESSEREFWGGRNRKALGELTLISGNEERNLL